MNFEEEREIIASVDNVVPIKAGPPLKPIASAAEMQRYSDELRRKQHRFPLIPFAELRPSSERTYLVKGLLPRVGLIPVWGPPKCGKSFWVSDLALHVALGWEYRGRKVVRGAVVYCAFEGADGFRARAEAFRRHHGIEADESVPFHLSPTRMELVKDHKALIDSIRQQISTDRKLALAVLDTLNRSLTGSESRDEDMSDVKAADAIREAFDCAVLIVHHCGVEGTRPRGHTSLTGAADAQIAVSRDGANNITALLEWMKDGPEGATITSRLESVEVGSDEDGDPITSCVVVAGDPSTANVSGRRKLSGSNKIAFDLLGKAIAEAGEKPAASNHIPGDRMIVSTEMWRRYCYEGSIAATDTPQARQKAFIRACGALQNKGLVGIWAGSAWIV